ncbi:MAG: response regulator [Thermomonas sp.]|uniref:response regulator n=1 Tax=Thermomonas sp. TaxID=1971895 RepID=UPI0039E612BF
MNTAPLPRILLVEDDPVSAAFLREAIAALPAQLDAAASIAEAEALLRASRHALLLVDANLPDGRGETLLQRARDLGITAPALAHTADAGAADALRAAGFLDVLVKPLGVTTLHAVLRKHLPSLACADWDDAAALAAVGGQQAHVDALRGLFRQELPGQCARIAAAFDARDHAAMRAELHRLAASCGFVGAARLGETVRGLLAAPDDGDALGAFLSAVDALLA